MSNIYERHNYIKNKVESTKKQLELDLLQDEREIEQRRKHQSVPKYREGAKSGLLPDIDSKQDITYGRQPRLKQNAYNDN